MNDARVSKSLLICFFHSMQGLRFCLLLLGLILGGCDNELVSPLRVASHEWPGYEPLHLARDLGFYDEHKIHVYEVPSATSTIRAFRNGYIDVAALTLDEALLLLQDQVPIKILLVMDVSNGADAVLGGGSVETLGDLKGKRIGVESSALGAYMLSRTLSKANLTNQDIQPVYIPFNKHLQAYQQQQVDALVTFEPNKTLIQKSGGKVLMDSRELANEIFDVLVIRESVIASHRDAVNQLIEGWFKALTYLETQPKNAADRISKRINVSADEFLNSLKEISIPNRAQNKEFLTGHSPQLLITGQRLAEVILRYLTLQGHYDLGHVLIFHLQVLKQFPNLILSIDPFL